MDRENNVASDGPSLSPHSAVSSTRGKGWSLNRHRRSTWNANVAPGATAERNGSFNTCRDRDGKMISSSVKTLETDAASAAQEVEGNRRLDNCGVSSSLAELSAQKQGTIVRHSTMPEKYRPAITRSVSFAFHNEQSLSPVWRPGESSLTLPRSTPPPRGHHVTPDAFRQRASLGSNSSTDTRVSGNNDICTESRVSVILRNNRSVRKSSPTELIKRRSVEISELRYALEEKIRTQQRNRGGFSNGKSSLSELASSPQYRPTKTRPRSMCGLPSWGDYPENQHVPKTSLEYRKNNKNSPNRDRPLVFNRISSSSSFSEFRKQQYLLGEHFSSPCIDRNLSGPFLCHRCSSPVTMSPQHSQGSYWSEGEERSSLYHTPVGSPSFRAPQPARAHHETLGHKASGEPVRTSDGRLNYYPNCDPTIWIRSCTKEVTEPLEGVQFGEVPRWLRGALIRNGPGRIQVGDDQYNHVFDGSALLHRFHFREGRVTYQSRFLRSRSYLNDTKAQRIVINYFGTRAHPDPCKTILQNIASKFTLEEHFTDNAQISLYPYGDSLYALTETPFIFRVDPDTLETHEKVNLTRHLAVFNHTAHPHVDRDGTVYNLGQGVGPLGPRYHICKFPKTKTDSKGKVRSPFEQAQVVGSVSARWLLNPCYMHSFAMTDNYWVIIEQPLVVSVAKILKVIVKQDALIDALQWWEKETKIHVVRRDTGRVTTTQYVTETFFFLHTINAYEDRGHIVLDIAAYKNAEMLHCMFVEALKNAAYDPTYAQMFRGRPKRWVLPLQPDKDAGPHTNLVTLPDTRCRGRWLKKGVVYVTPELLADIGCEVPRIHYEEYNGRPYQYFYAICSDVDHPSPGTLVKVDVVNKRHIEWSEDNVYPSEPIFVPAPLAQREDEGVVLTALLRARGLDREVCLLVLDARTFTELGRVEFTAPGPVPKCLHGWFVPEGAFAVHRQQEQDRK